MSLPDPIRNSQVLRRPLLAASRALFLLLKSGPALLRRAVYDAMPVPYLVTGRPEHFVVATADKVIGRELFLHGEFDFAKLQTALAIIEREGLPRPQHLIDVGANIGTIVIPALARGLMQSATAIEPHPTNLRLLRANLALNGLSERVRVLAQAVGTESHASLFLTESSTNSGNHSIGRTGLPVASTRLDDVDCPHDGALLWMDIEGYEGHALRGAPNLLATGIPVVCEFNTGYLENSGGMNWFREALAGRRIFDLKQGEKAVEITLDQLAVMYPAGHEFTDVLALKMGDL
ncbi:FkbM family methyltransferase [Acidovorax sp. YS12]|nr:FkbM family methyltransferase [Acidovorax sp. YS12]